MLNIEQCRIKVNVSRQDQNYYIGLDLVEVKSEYGIKIIPRNVFVFSEQNKIYGISMNFHVDAESLIFPDKVCIKHIQLSSGKTNLSYIEDYDSSSVAQEYFRIATKVISPMLQQRQSGEILKYPQDAISIKLAA